MFGVDFSEVMVILVVALIVIGPERLPKVARTLGLLWARAQRYVNGAKAGIAREMPMEEFHQWQQKVNQEVLRAEQAAHQITQTLDQQAQQLNSTVVQSVPQTSVQQVQTELPPEAQNKFPVD